MGARPKPPWKVEKLQPHEVGRCGAYRCPNPASHVLIGQQVNTGTGTVYAVRRIRCPTHLRVTLGRPRK